MPDIRSVSETASTNDDVSALALQGAEEGVWLRADRQTAGRGRQGKVWQSSAGNLLASTLVRIRAGDPPAPTLALVAAVALAEVVELIGHVRPVIKWPNDLLVDGAKLSGILLERTGDAVIVGFGVNLAHHPEGLDRPTTSLAALNGVAPAPNVVALALAETFARWVARWRSEGMAPLRARWLERAHPAGSALSAKLPDGTALDGLFDGLDESGALRLRLADGTTHVIHAADVFLIGD